jgi:hypothetical protein
MSEEIANHSEESPEIQMDAATEAVYASFGLAPKAEKKEIEFPTVTEEPETEETEEPAPTTAQEQPTKGIKVKYNGEEKLVSEDEAPTLIQKGMNYDKVQQRLQDQEKALDEVAVLQGFKNHADLIENLPKLREQQQKQRQSELDNMKTDMLDQLEANGIDRESAEKWIENHPTFKAGREALENQRVADQKAAESDRWGELYKKYPNLWDEVQKSNGAPVEWFSGDFERMVQEGNRPLLVYEHLFRDQIQAKTKKDTEQKLIKQQQLGARSQVEGSGAPEPEANDLLPEQVALAELYGVSTKGVKQQQKMIQNRR